MAPAEGDNRRVASNHRSGNDGRILPLNNSRDVKHQIIGQLNQFPANHREYLIEERGSLRRLSIQVPHNFNNDVAACDCLDFSAIRAEKELARGSRL